MLLGILLATPLVVALTCLLVPRRKVAVYANAIGAGVILVLGLIIAGRVFLNGKQYWFGGFLYFDALNAYILATISIVGFMGCLYSIGYMGKEVDEGVIDAKKFGRYFFWLHLFIFAMLMVVSVNNLGVLWVFVEGTTLATALLVGFYHTKASLEAAWKYIIICSVGITFALFGTILIYFAGTKAMGSVGYALNWTELVRNAASLDPKLLKLAFVFILVGYGTKAGLVPMHTWLPDAHSQAPSPVSALLSGVLLNCALYGIIRFHIILSQSPVGSGYSAGLLILFGVLSVGFVVPFILIQHDIKRLLAYSSIEHMGLITLGIGF
ncbi:MAG TPA: proton-conducting transporter membrane subunit, partial [Verrucomicrobiae bacterium]|nr:proton-conducting transporter membrane subunit [Verrucomicrobiae bacterium]